LRHQIAKASDTRIGWRSPEAGPTDVSLLRRVNEQIRDQLPKLNVAGSAGEK
jgi:hypothetical protein